MVTHINDPTGDVIKRHDLIGNGVNESVNIEDAYESSFGRTAQLQLINNQVNMSTSNTIDHHMLHNTDAKSVRNLVQAGPLHRAHSNESDLKRKYLKPGLTVQASHW